jgi:hypothetical protein
VGGVQNSAAVWALSDISVWLSKIGTNKGRDIPVTREKFLKSLVGAGSPLVPESNEGGSALLPPNSESVSPSAVATYNLYLPANLDNRDMMVMEMSHVASCGAEPISYKVCCDLIDSLIEELNEQFLTELGAADNPVRAGPDEEDECEAGTKFIFVGFSHATRLALAADILSLTYSVINLTGGKITAASVEEACEQLKDEVCTAVGKVVVIYHIFDNNAYFCVDEDGSKALPTKNGGGDGRYHVKGRLEQVERRKKSFFRRSRVS